MGYHNSSVCCCLSLLYDWDSELVIHWCLGLVCPVCGGDEGRAKRNTLGAVKLSLCRSCVVPLEYRWKGMDEASAGAYRGVKQHQLMPSSLRGIFDSAKVARRKKLKVSPNISAHGVNYVIVPGSH